MIPSDTFRFSRGWHCWRLSSKGIVKDCVLFLRTSGEKGIGIVCVDVHPTKKVYHEFNLLQSVKVLAYAGDKDDKNDKNESESAHVKKIKAMLVKQYGNSEEYDGKTVEEGAVDVSLQPLPQAILLSFQKDVDALVMIVVDVEEALKLTRLLNALMSAGSEAVRLYITENFPPQPTFFQDMKNKYLCDFMKSGNGSSLSCCTRSSKDGNSTDGLVGDSDELRSYPTGVIVKVKYDENLLLYVVAPGHDNRRIGIPIPEVFEEDMYLRGRVINYRKASHTHNSGLGNSSTYDILFIDGPYANGTFPDGRLALVTNSDAESRRVERPSTIAAFARSKSSNSTNHRNQSTRSINASIRSGEGVLYGKQLERMKSKSYQGGSFIMVKNVQGKSISVDYSDIYTYPSTPWFIILITLSQIIFYIYQHHLSSRHYNFGKSMSFMMVVPFPHCDDVRSEYWRFVSYQWLHNGQFHLLLNMCLQLIFGIPINMVQGNVRVGLAYELSVVAGALSSSMFDPYAVDLRGCSAGIYGLMGLHISDLVINGRNDKHCFIFNRISRTVFLLIVLGGDVAAQYLSLYSKLEDSSNNEDVNDNNGHSLSWSAHLGGLVIGFFSGLFVLNNFEKHVYEVKYLKPFAILVTLLLFLSSFYLYDINDPPIPIYKESLFGGNGESSIDKEREFRCCWKLRDCFGDKSTESFNRQFVCDYKSLYYHNEEITSCNEMKWMYNKTGF